VSPFAEKWHDLALEIFGAIHIEMTLRYPDHSDFPVFFYGYLHAFAFKT
jgi:hypothetical protein